MKKKLLIFLTIFGINFTANAQEDYIDAYVSSVTPAGCGNSGSITFILVNAEFCFDFGFGCNYLPMTVNCQLYGPNGYYADFGGGYPAGYTFYFSALAPGTYNITLNGESGDFMNAQYGATVSDLGENPHFVTSTVNINCSIEGSMYISNDLDYSDEYVYVNGPNGYYQEGYLAAGAGWLLGTPYEGTYNIDAYNDCPTFSSSVAIAAIGDLPLLSTSVYTELCSDSGSVVVYNAGTAIQTFTMYPLGDAIVNPGEVYTFNVTDSGINSFLVEAVTGSCPDIASQTVEINYGNQALLLTETHNNSSDGQANGSINLLVQNGTPPYTYSWDNGQITQDNPNLFAGTYTVVVTDDNDCTETLTVTIVDPSAIENIAQSLGNVSITPNPATGGEVILNLDARANQNLTISVFNNFGQEMLNRKVAGITQGVNKIRLDIQNGLPAGIYSLRISNDQQQGQMVLPFLYIAE